MTDTAEVTLFDGVVGQERAVASLRASLARPVHAYLFLGPPGSSKEAAAIGFAAGLRLPERRLRGVRQLPARAARRAP